MAEQTYIEGVGRRKSATARVRIYPGGKGAFTVNGRTIEQYFDRQGDSQQASKALTLTGTRSAFDVTVLVKGGGVSGQVGAVALGLARALIKHDPEFRTTLKRAGLLRRDPRVKERKKPGLKRARKAPTYTKR